MSTATLRYVMKQSFDTVLPKCVCLRGSAPDPAGGLAAPPRPPAVKGLVTKPVRPPPLSHPDLRPCIDELLIWSKKWQLPFNESKCKAMHYGKTNRKADYNLGGVNIKEVSEEKDLGVTFDQQNVWYECE